MPHARLTDRAVLVLRGEESEHFLQNLVTADIPSIGERTARPSALLTPQGKILFDFLVSRIEGGFRLDCVASIRDALARRLAIYKLRAKVAIEPSDDPVFALWDLSEPADVIIADERFGQAGVGRAYDAGSLPEAPEAEAGDYRALRLRAGILEAETDFPQTEMFPHDVLLDQNGGVSFRKGCYVGQEVVSRMQHRGTARRRAMLVVADRHLTEGAPLTSAGKPIGTLLASAHGEGVAVVRIDKLAAALVRGEGACVDGVPVDLSIPPWAGYALPEPAPAGGEAGDGSDS
ncbi:folate-binding protein [Fulvimarina endophytica]|uniref:Folate-binding protein n=1 Tax=Fulvimarina endophytica TaxID=2293836 RepID=A0A371X5K8_9HYPH|nr:folate-binding protein YgfZ [Fulvimarina endophytica]RFC64497.1 folate-binding protein [Fulvimarina endophytica]